MTVLFTISFYLRLLGTRIFYRHVFVFERNEHSCSYDGQNEFQVPSSTGNLKSAFTVVTKGSSLISQFWQQTEAVEKRRDGLQRASSGWEWMFETCKYGNFSFMWPCIVTNFFVIKPTRCTNFKNLFCHETLYVSDSSSVHHQGFIHCTLSNGICHTGL